MLDFLTKFVSFRNLQIVFYKILFLFIPFGLFAQAPTISSFSPNGGSIGTLVTIAGTNLSTPTALTIGGVSAIVISNTGTSLVAMVMPGAATGLVSVTTAGGTANSTGKFTVTASQVPNGQQGSKLVGTGAVGAALQGAYVSVSADGNTAIVGAFLDNGGTGAAWVYTRNGAIWSQQGSKLVGTGTVGNAQQGYSVSLSADGNTAIVGGVQDNSSAGAAWVYTRSGGVWSQQGSKLVGTGAVGNAQQGYTVSISADGNTAIVGGWADNSNAGAAWVYTRSGGVWSQQGSKLVGTSAVGNAQQGISVSLSADGNTAIVGGRSDNSNAGAAWVYTRNGGVWSQQGAKLVGSGVSAAAQQGRSVSLSADGNTAMVGGNFDNSQQGAVWVYTRSEGVWSQQGSKLVGTGAVGAAQLGLSVSLSADGNIAIVSGFPDNSNAGAVWVYTRSGGVWTQQGSKLVGTGAVGNAQQGSNVSLSADGNTAMFGGPLDNSNAGAVWAFTYVPPPPTITSTGTLTVFSACAGAASTAQSFTVGGTNLTNNITITPPTGFEVSLTSGSGYAASVSITPTSNIVANTTIYVRLTNSASGTPSGNITVASTGSTTQNVAVTGTINALPVATITASGPTTFCPGGQVGLYAPPYLLQFNGNSTVSVANGYPATDDITIQMTIKPTAVDLSVNQYKTLLNHDNYDIGNLHFQFLSGRLQLAIGGIAEQFCTYTFVPGSTYRIAAAYSKDGKYVKFYVNGVLINNFTYTTTVSILGNQSYNIGSWKGTSRFFNGTIDDVRIWNTVRTDAQVLSDAAADFLPAGTPNLVRYYRFDEGIGTTTADDAGGATGILVNNPLWVSSAPVGQTYLWSNAGTKQNITATTGGNYTVTVTNPSGCAATSSATVVTVNPLPTATISGTTTVTTNITSPNITFTGAGGTAPYTFSYTINSGATQTVTTTSGNSVSVAAPTNAAGTFAYSLVGVKDGSSTSCSNTATGTATVTVVAITATISGTTTVCQNTTAPNITFTGANGTAPYTFTYTINGGANQMVTTTTTTDNSVTVAAPTGTSGMFTYALVSVQDATAAMNTNTPGKAVVTINGLPVATITPGGATTFCSGGSVTLTASAGSSYVWNNSAGTSGLINVTTSGNYTVTVVDVNGCSATSPATTVTVNPLPTASIAGTTVVCQNGTAPNITFTGAAGTVPYTFSYTINGGTTQMVITTKGNSVTVAVPTTTAGVYTYALVSVQDASSTSCLNAATGNATVTVNPLPIASISGTTTICQNAATPNITFTGAAGTAPYTFSYIINGGAVQTITTTTGNSVTVAAPTSIAGTYAYSLVNVQDASSNTCTNATTGTATVTVNPLPTASISAASTVICGAGNTTNLVATGGTTYQWFRNGSLISGATSSTYAAATIGTYTATTTSAFGCTAPTTGSLVVTQLFAPKSSFNYDSYCTNKAINFTNKSTVTTTGAVSYTWSDNNANTSSATNARFMYPNAGSYSIKLKVQSNTCSNLADSVTVVVPVEAPRAAIRQTTLDVAINDNVQLQARNFGNQYTWSPSVGLTNPFISNPVINTSAEQDYLITIGVPSGCTTTDSLKVRIHDSNKVYVPNVFSPNGDGQNDKLYLIPVGISELKFFRIFNRWGKKLFETSTLSQGWDGTFNGQLQPLETYVWTVLAVDKNGKTFYQEGSVTLLR